MWPFKRKRQDYLVVAHVKTPWGDGFVSFINDRSEVSRYTIDLFKTLAEMEVRDIAGDSLVPEDEVQVVIINIIKLDV